MRGSGGAPAWHARVEYDARLTERLLEAGTFVSFTFQAGGYQSLLELRAAERLTPQEARERSELEAYFDGKRELFRCLLRDGMLPRLVLSTDAGPGDTEFGRLLHGLELAVEAGMSAPQALAAVTRVAAEACGVGALVGTLEVGKEADLLVADGNPLVDVRAIGAVQAVYVAGERIGSGPFACTVSGGGIGGLLAALALLALTACAPPGGASSGPTPVPEPPSIQNLPGRGVAIQGHGTSQTDDITPQFDAGLTEGIDLVTLTHDGRSTFIVSAVEGDQTELLTSAIGAYTGQRPLVVQGTRCRFQVTADGSWTVRVQPMPRGGTPAFSGTGDAVSAYFTPPTNPAAWKVSHDGKSSFFVYAHCVGGSIVVEDRTGAFEDTAQIPFSRGPCFWEVRADGGGTCAGLVAS